MRGRTAVAVATGGAMAGGTTLGVVGRRTLGGVWRDARRRRRTVDAISVLDVRHPTGLGVKVGAAGLDPRTGAGARAHDLLNR